MQEEQIMADAYAEARDQMRQDAQLLADGDAEQILDYLGDHLFDPTLDVQRIRRGSEATEAGHQRFVEKLGPLKAYCDKYRIHVAVKLITDSDLPVKQIGPAVGFKVQRTFRRAVQAKTGRSPTALREQARNGVPREDGEFTSQEGEPTCHPESPASDDAPFDPAQEGRSWRRKIALLQADVEDAALFRRHLRGFYPQLAETPVLPAWVQGPVLLSEVDPDLKLFVGRRVLEEILTMPANLQRHAIFHVVRFSGATPIDLLYDYARHLLVENRIKAIRLAELMVEIVLHSVPTTQIDERTLAWTYLGDILTRARDLGGAFEAFNAARFEWEHPRENEGYGILAHFELVRCEARLRMLQREHHEAARLLDEALRLLPLDEYLREQYWDECFELRADCAWVISKHEEALEILERAATFRRTAMGALIAGRCHRQLGRQEEAEQSLQEAWELGASSTVAAFVELEEGRLALKSGRKAAAEACFRASRRRFEDLGEWVRTTLPTAELIIVLLDTGRRDEARELSEQTATLLELQRLHCEARHAARFLRALPRVSRIEEEHLHYLRILLEPVGREVKSP